MEKSLWLSRWIDRSYNSLTTFYLFFFFLRLELDLESHLGIETDRQHHLNFTFNDKLAPMDRNQQWTYGALK